MQLIVFCALVLAAGAEEETSQVKWQVDTNKPGGLLESLTEKGCIGKRCFDSDDCCRAAACVQVDGISGTCLPVFSKRPSELCERDSDCVPPSSCLLSEDDFTKRCQLEGEKLLEKKGFNDACATSSDCDLARGLCCQVMRRHRMAAKKLCFYFLDPKSCVGPVPSHIPEISYLPNSLFKARMG